MIDDLWKCESAANYLENQWLKEPALWSQSLVSLLETALKKHIRGNNQHMEGVIKCLGAARYINELCRACRVFLYSV